MSTMIEIVNWERYNPRTDIKKSHWFRVENNLFTDQKFYETGSKLVVIWIYLLSIASQKNKFKFELSVKLAKNCLNLHPRTIFDCLHKLVDNESIIVESDDSEWEAARNVHERTRNVRVRQRIATEHNRTEHNRTEHNKSCASSANATLDAHTSSGIMLVVKDEDEKKEISDTEHKKNGGNGKGEALTSETWLSYSSAFKSKYGAEPPRNAKVNAQLKQFVSRIGREHAPFVADFYVHHNNSWYSSRGHSVAQMLSDAEKLYVEWKTQRKINPINSKQLEKQDSYVSQIEKIRRGEL